MDSEVFKAVVSGNLEYFENISNTDPHKFRQVTSDQKNTILHLATKCGDLKIAEKIIDSCQTFLHETNSKGDSSLHVSARLGDVEMTKLIIDKAQLIEVEAEKKILKMKNLTGDTALHEAVRNGCFYVVKIMLLFYDKELGNFVNNVGESPLFVAIDQKYYEIAHFILHATYNCSFGGRNGMNVLHAAIIRGAKEHSSLASYIRKELYFLPSSMEYAAQTQMSSLEKVSKGFIGAEFIREVIKRDPSAIFEADKFGWTPLHYAAYTGNSQAVKILLESDISIANTKNKEGMSALHIAAKAGHADIIQILITKYPEITDLVSAKGQTALHVAAECGNRNVISQLLKMPIMDDLINAQDFEGNTAFHLATMKDRRMVLVKLAYNHRVDKGVLNKKGMTATDIAKSKKIRNIELLGDNVPSLELSIKRENNQDMHANTNPQEQDGKEIEDKREKASKTAKEIASLNSVIATIIASVTFAAAVTMPGGFYSDSKEHPGMAILTQKIAFRVFVIANSVAFGSSACLMLLPLVFFVKKIDIILVKVLAISTNFMVFSVYSMVIAFVAATYVVLGLSSGLAIAAIVAACVSFFAIVLPFDMAVIG